MRLDELEERSRVVVSTSELCGTSDVDSGNEGPTSVISMSVSRWACSGVRSWIRASSATSCCWEAMGVGAMTLTTGLAMWLG
jgi:hypothetical protein